MAADLKYIELCAPSNRFLFKKQTKLLLKNQLYRFDGRGSKYIAKYRKWRKVSNFIQSRKLLAEGTASEMIYCSPTVYQ
jgi:hypothetical protein